MSPANSNENVWVWLGKHKNAIYLSIFALLLITISVEVYQLRALAHNNLESLQNYQKSEKKLESMQ